MKNIRRNLGIASRMISTAKSMTDHPEAQEAFSKADYVVNRSFNALETVEHMKRELDSGRAQVRLLGMMSQALMNGKIRPR